MVVTRDLRGIGKIRSRVATGGSVGGHKKKKKKKKKKRNTELGEKCLMFKKNVTT